MDHSQKINRKMYRGALRAILSELVRQERLVVVESFKVEGPKTKVLSERLGKMGLNDVLVITDEHDEALVLSARNLHWVDVLDITEVNPVSLIAFDKVVVTVPALKKLEERLA